MKRTEHTQKWLDALRSGEYEQCRRMLGGREIGKYCCLAVGMDVLNIRDIDDLEIAGIDSDEDLRALVRMNDEKGLTFPQIADEIEKMLDVN